MRDCPDILPATAHCSLGTVLGIAAVDEHDNFRQVSLPQWAND